MVTRSVTMANLPLLVIVVGLAGLLVGCGPAVTDCRLVADEASFLNGRDARTAPDNSHEEQIAGSLWREAKDRDYAYYYAACRQIEAGNGL